MEHHIQGRTISEILDVPPLSSICKHEYRSNSATVSSDRQDERDDEVRNGNHQRDNAHHHCGVHHVVSLSRKGAHGSVSPSTSSHRHALDCDRSVPTHTHVFLGPSHARSSTVRRTP